MVVRAQISMEYLLIVGFALILLIPIILIAYTQSADFESDVTAAQVQKVGNEIVDAVNTVYYAGPPTKKTIKVFFPKNIEQVTITGDTLVFTMYGRGGKYQYALYAESNMTGSIASFSGIHVITVVAGANDVNVTES